MLSNFLDSPKLFRHLVEDLPVGIYIVDQERQIRFWNRSAERLTGHLSHEVVGRAFDEAVKVCDRRGNPLTRDSCPVTRTLLQRQPQQCTGYFLHKNGHRTAMRIRTRPFLEYGEVVSGATVLFQENCVRREDSPAPMFGCLDAVTGIPSRRLARAFLKECLAVTEGAQTTFGLLRVRLPELKDFAAKHGKQSTAPFLRTTAHTLRNSLDADSFLGCWGENEFLAVLTSASPLMVAMTADVLANLLSHSEVQWWGDHFLIVPEVSYTMAHAGDRLDELLRQMQPAHKNGAAKAAAASSAGDSGNQRG